MIKLYNRVTDPSKHTHLYTTTSTDETPYKARDSNSRTKYKRLQTAGYSRQITEVEETRGPAYHHSKSVIKPKR